jgi:hypothetical protein
VLFVGNDDVEFSGIGGWVGGAEAAAVGSDLDLDEGDNSGNNDESPTDAYGCCVAEAL